MDELLKHEGAFPSPQPPTTDGKSPIPSDTINELKAVYLKAYAPYIDSFLETAWYSTTGVSLLVQNQLLCEQLQMILRFFAHGDPANPDIHSHETRLIWELMKMCYAAPGVDVKSFTDRSLLASYELDVEAVGIAKRLKVFEQLICGQHAEVNILDSFGGFQDDFWKALGHFITLPDHDGDSLKMSERTLGMMRGTLNVQENRDVLYSVAVIRHFKDRRVSSAFAPTNDEDDPQNRLRVAKMFINNEASGKSSNEVVTRLCSLILKCQAAQTGKIKVAT